MKIALVVIIVMITIYAVDLRSSSIKLLDIIDSSANAIVTMEDTIALQKNIIRALRTNDKLRSLGSFTCTAYESGPTSCGKWADGMTSTMVPVGLGIAAADPSVLPYGSILFVEELGRYFIVMDRGGAIRGNRLDLYTNSVDEALELGRFNSVVYIVNA